MHSIRAKLILFTASAVVLALGVATAIGIISIHQLGIEDADQMLHLTATTGALHLDAYFESVEHSVNMVATMVQERIADISVDQLPDQVEQSRYLFDKVSNHTNGVLTYYFRIDPEVSDTEKGFWYVRQPDGSFQEHEVTDISQYDTSSTDSLVWFTIPKKTGAGIWLPPYYTENLWARVISYNAPVYWHNQFIGVIGIEIDYETLSREVESIRVLDTGYAFILDEDSNLIYHPRMDTLDWERAKTAIYSHYRKLGENHVAYVFDGMEKEAVWLPLRNGMRLFVTAPLSEIDRGWQGMIKNVLLAALLILVAISLLMVRLANRLTKPLRQLTEAAKQVEHGNYDFDLPYDKNDEVGILTRSFKQLADHTKIHISDLHRQVYVDALTSVRNKAGYSAYIQELQDRIDADGAPPEFAFGVFDCDNLKHINDTYGHDKGDLYLKMASRLICRIFAHSPVFRIGGDEFAVILEDESLRNREELVSQFRKSREEICNAAENEWDQVNVTMGLAVYDPAIDTAVIDVARRADRSMYETKRIRKIARG